MVDYSNGQFDPLSFISLTPLVVGGLATLIVLNELFYNPRRFGLISKKVMKWYLFALGIAFFVGLYTYRFGAIFDLANYLCPIGLMGFGAIFARYPQVMRRWGISAAVVGVLVAIYGLYQFYTIPTWDAFWVRAVGFEGYLGTLEPTKMTLFSTMHERGPAAMFLGGTLVLILLRPKLLSGLRFPAAAIVLVAMLLTYVRSSAIFVGLTVIALPLVTKGQGLITIAILSIIGVLFSAPLSSSMPGAEQVGDRMATLGNIQEDGSFKGRIILMGIALRQGMTRPLGLGLGSQGQSSRVSDNNNQEGIGDSTGYLQILTTFGWIGTYLIVRTLYQLWNSSTIVWNKMYLDRDVALFRAWFISGMVLLFTGNWLAGVTYFWLLAGYVLGCHDRLLKSAGIRHAREPVPFYRPKINYKKPNLQETS